MKIRLVYLRIKWIPCTFGKTCYQNTLHECFKIKVKYMKVVVISIRINIHIIHNNIHHILSIWKLTDAFNVLIIETTDFADHVFCLYQISVDLLWIQTLCINTSICVRGTEWWLTVEHTKSILITQTDLVFGIRCCVLRECVNAAIGRLNGVGIIVCVYQCLIRV